MLSRVSKCATSSISPGKNSVAWQQESRKKQSQERNKNMLSQSQRATILQLHAQGVKKREIARLLGISRLSVRKVLRSNSAQVPMLQRAEKAEPYREQILELLARCKGNLVRVHEELLASGAVFSYQALTAFCRRHGLTEPPQQRSEEHTSELQSHHDLV